jgi:hypothetical protein
MSKRTLELLIVMAIVVVAAPLGLILANPGPTAVTENPDWEPAQALSVLDEGEKLPVIAAFPPNDQLVVLYGVHDAANNTDDIAYRSSNNGGETWSAPQVVFSSPLTDSVQADVAFAGNGVAHAVWVEDIQLAYAPQSAWGSGNVSYISEPILPPGASNPDLAISNDGTLHVVWTEGEQSTPDVYYARSEDGGNNWTASLVYPSGPSSFSPSLAFDPANANTVYVVWEEKTGAFGNIRYSEGSLVGDNMTWTNAIEISELGETDLGDSRDFRPRIVWQNGERQVAYTHALETDPDQQTIYYTACSANCTSRSGWSIQQNISGQFVGANATDPFTVYSTMTTFEGCTYAYFHGTDSDFSQDNEGIWGVNSCDNWAASGRDQVTNPMQSRSIYPVLATHPDGWLYLVYEQVSEEQRQVYFTRGQAQAEGPTPTPTATSTATPPPPPGDGGVYLPLILNN